MVDYIKSFILIDHTKKKATIVKLNSLNSETEVVNSFCYLDILKG